MDILKIIFPEDLINSKERVAGWSKTASIRLDKNELPFDIGYDIKKAVLESVSKEEWNRYPNANNIETESLIANHIGISPDNIVVGPGAANIIISLLNYFALSQKEISIVQPSYPLFDYYCKTYQIHYTPWFLDANLEFDLHTLPRLKDGSVVFLASPNNPVGNIIAEKELAQLLAQHPGSIFVVDEVYHEFAEMDFMHLVAQYPNLILLRSLSKTMSAAGIRLGYMIGSKAIAEQVKKLILSFSLNYLTLSFAKIILTNNIILDYFRTNVKTIINEREKLFGELEKIAPGYFQVKKSHGNFLLIKFDNADYHSIMLDLLSMEGIKVLNVSSMKFLENSIRVGIGTPFENEALLEMFQNLTNF